MTEYEADVERIVHEEMPKQLVTESKASQRRFQLRGSRDVAKKLEAVGAWKKRLS
ncbi:hypothetical protein AB2L27_20160 [Kineococcus sp. LSe6-4]|uniref:Uncharacterized protein n=1 Tax=Kineococcus halophytocola TaxID=3234027 RepID=A0ABV4H656_9ACTN